MKGAPLFSRLFICLASIFFIGEQGCLKADLYTNNLKNREFDKEVPQNCCQERVTIAGRQGTNDDKNFEVKPTQSKTDSSGCLCISENNKIVFLHIPKTGGVTVSSLLANEYYQNQIEGQSPLLYSYGFHYSLHEINQQKELLDFRLITFLRNPVSRVLSEQSYCMGKWKGNSGILSEHKLPAQGEPIHTAKNVVCKLLSGLNDQDPLIPIEVHLEHAKLNLEQRFYFVGITEKMEESIRLLYKHLGWSSPEKIPQFNQSHSGSYHYSEEVLQGIAERNWADIELYEYALSLYEEQKNHISSLEDNQAQEGHVFYDSYRYTFDQKLKGYGWAFREKLKNKTVYRWVSDTNEAVIDFNLNTEHGYSLRFNLLIQPILLENFIMQVNGVPIPIKIAYQQLKRTPNFIWLECSATIPKSLLIQKEKTRLSFKMSSPQEPDLLECFQSNDQQNKGYDSNYIRGKFACSYIDFSELEAK